MNNDMAVDVFAEQSFGKVALKKLGKVSENFRLYRAGWLGKHPTRDIMEVTGAEFRAAKSGPNAGKLSIKVNGSDKTVHVTKEEMQAEDQSCTTA